MKLIEIKENVTWNKEVVAFDDYTFLQSWEWGEINSNEGKENVFRYVVKDNDEVIGMAQAFTISAKRGKILFLPHGPLFKNKKAWEMIIKELLRKARELNCVCLRVAAWEIRSESSEKKYSELGFKKAGVIMHAEDTWLVDLRGSEEEVLGRMRKTTRNLIRRGERDGIKIWKSDKIEDVDHLYDLQMEVVKRNGFVPFSKKYLKKELEVLGREEMSVLFLGEGSEGVVGAALIVFLGKYAFYYQSGSRVSKEPVNYLLQWEVMKEARKRGCEIYNMWGVMPVGAKDHPWQGLSMFKMGFGGEQKEYMKAMDYPINKVAYLKLKVFEKIPKTWRNVLTGRLG